MTGLAAAGVIIPGGGYSGGGKAVLRGMHHPEIAKAVRKGIAAHVAYNPGIGYNLRYVLPSGKRPDAVHLAKRIVRELKPNNPRAIADGTKQLQGYLDEFTQLMGPGWRGYLDTY